MDKLDKQFRIPIPEKTKDKVTTAASREGVSISKFVRAAVRVELKSTHPPIKIPPGKMDRNNQAFNIPFTKQERMEIRGTAGLRDVSVCDFIRSAVDRELEK